MTCPLNDCVQYWRVLSHSWYPLNISCRARSEDVPIPFVDSRDEGILTEHQCQSLSSAKLLVLHYLRPGISGFISLTSELTFLLLLRNLLLSLSLEAHSGFCVRCFRVLFNLSSLPMRIPGWYIISSWKAEKRKIVNVKLRLVLYRFEFG